MSHRLLDPKLRSFEYKEEKKDGDRCENCFRRGTRCIQVLRTLAAAIACQACKSSRIRCSFVAEWRNKGRQPDDLNLDFKSPLRLSPAAEAERQSKLTASTYYPVDGVVIELKDNTSQNSGDRSGGDSSSSHEYSRDVDQSVEEKGGQLAEVYKPLPLTFSTQNTTFKNMSGVVIAINGEGEVKCCGGWQRWLPKGTENWWVNGLSDTLPCAPGVWFEVNDEGTVIANFREGRYFSTLWKDLQSNSHPGDFAHGSSNYGSWRSSTGRSSGSIDGSIDSSGSGTCSEHSA
jgi:hypothetical protein